MNTTLGTLLINESLPEKYKIRPGEAFDKKKLKNLMVDIARQDPGIYPDVVINLKRVGDLLSTLEPYSPGLDDLETPEISKNFLHDLDTKVRQAPTFDKKVELLSNAQSTAIDHAMTSTGNLGSHVRSGSRGNPAQLMRMVVSPVAVRGAKRGISPLTIKNSFSQGLTPGEYYASALEARLNAIESQLQVQKPGAVNKTFTSNLNTLLITEKDCGTSNGLYFDISDPHVVDRYLAQDQNGFTRNTLVDSLFIKEATARKINKVKVRSSMTCSSRDGVCAHCYGLLENKHMGDIGTNIGVRSAQAMSEPLTQMALDSKHAAKLSTAKGMRGLAAIEQLTKVPKNFLNKAIVAKVTGIITKVTPAPHGGYYVYIGSKEHYVEPGFKVFVKQGQSVEAGDILSEGIPSPKEIVEYKGLGAGRKYYVDALHGVYNNSGTDLDKRHLENLAKQTLNYVRVNKSDVDNDIYAGEVYSYNKIKDLVKQTAQLVDIDSAFGKILADEYLEYTAGSILSKSMIDHLKQHDIDKVLITLKNPQITPIMTSADMTPLLNPDLLAKMGFRYLKSSFVNGVQEGVKSDIHGTSPWPGYMYGKEFGKGPRGHY